MAVLNGRLPVELLGKIPDSGIAFPKAFIPQVVALREAFQKRFNKPLSITDGYRPYSGSYYAQVETMLRRYKPAAEFRVLAPGSSTAGRKSHLWEGVRRYLLPGQAQVAFPGTSNHGKADHPALDLGSGVNVMDSDEHKWIVLNAPKFGFRWPSEWARAGREPWHIEATGVVQVSNKTDLDVDVNIDIDGLKELERLKELTRRNLMYIAISKQDDPKTYYLVGPAFCHRLTDWGQAKAFIESGLKAVELDNADITNIKNVMDAINSYTR